MKRKLIIGSVVISVLLSGCQFLESSKSAIDGYLGALKKDPGSKGGKWKCIENTHSQETPKNIQSWEISDQKQTSKESDPDAKYQLVSVKIKYIAPGNFESSQTWVAEVWNSDELFESQKRLIAKLNQLSIDSTNLANKVFKESGEPQAPEPKLTTPDRRTITSSKYCVARVYKAE
ncbi:hypothetical protein K9N68_15735 [Kovacikia minuta CCNUW1]|uniref:hypothetical protein n=1 Tax=Kovacikia minuta TaxID=2931930 RepID=UPI001CCA54E4|nr:hypothetical protein [Kovacikia minuta]UBF29154.1 hypothetical protein K9N68_15735 [Kovacikia minuta CCNUW1]